MFAKINEKYCKTSKLRILQNCKNIINKWLPIKYNKKIKESGPSSKSEPQMEIISWALKVPFQNELRARAKILIHRPSDLNEFKILTENSKAPLSRAVVALASFLGEGYSALGARAPPAKDLMAFGSVLQHNQHNIGRQMWCKSENWWLRLKDDWKLIIQVLEQGFHLKE